MAATPSSLRSRNHFGLLLTLALQLLSALSIGACQICLPFPTRSLADDLIEADYVALARENPDQPFILAATRLLKGEGNPPPLSLFLDSQSRRQLASYPNKSVVCVYLSKEPTPEWRRVAIDGPELKPIIAEILQRTPDWEKAPSERPRFFSPYLGSDDPQLATLAHLEIARAPYSEIKALASSIPVEDIRGFLGNFRLTEWHALYILLLAQSDHPEDQERIKEAAASRAKFSFSSHTAAWATAYIEIAEEEALSFFNDNYIENGNRSEEELRAVLAAYSVHGANGHTHLRDLIIDSFRKLASSHPELLPAITLDLKKWQRWDLTETVSQILISEPETFDLEGTLQLRSYLRDANTTKVPSPHISKSPATLAWIIGGLLILPLLIKLVGYNRSAADAPP